MNLMVCPEHYSSGPVASLLFTKYKVAFQIVLNFQYEVKHKYIPRLRATLHLQQTFVQQIQICHLTFFSKLCLGKCLSSLTHGQPLGIIVE